MRADYCMVEQCGTRIEGVLSREAGVIGVRVRISQRWRTWVGKPHFQCVCR